jgi:hypothetical protein
MAQTIDFYIDVTNGTLVAAGAARNGSLPTFTRNDSYNFRVRLQERDTSGFLRDLNTSGSSVKLGIGGIDDSPTDGSFKLVLNSVTSLAIPYNATAVCVFNSISAIASNSVSVTTYGSETSSFLITSATANSAMSFGGSSFTLFPTSSVIINTRRFPATSVSAQQVVRLIRNPAVYADTFVASPTAGIVAITKLQDGSSTKNETYNLAIGADAEGGSVVLNYGANSTTAIAIGSSAASFSEALSAVTGIGSGNISVEAGNNAGNYSISFVRSLGLQNITTTLGLDASGVIFGSFLQTTVTLATAELDELFAEAGTDTITPTIEVELTQSGTPKTVLQSSITVRRDLITTGSVVPADQASYYTKSETNSLFVEDLSSNVDATNRILSASDSSYSVDYGSRTLYDASYNALFTWGNGGNVFQGPFANFNTTCVGFYGTNPVSRPANINVVSGLINVGLIASGVSYGVLPQSSYSVTTLASVTFGTVAGNDQHYRDVVVTGATVNGIVLLGLPSAVSSGIVIQGVAYKANTVCLSAIHSDTGSVDLNTATYRITVIGY